LIGASEGVGNAAGIAELLLPQQCYELQESPTSANLSFHGFILWHLEMSRTSKKLNVNKDEREDALPFGCIRMMRGEGRLCSPGGVQ